MKRHKIISALLIGAMTLTFLTGCGGNNDTATKENSGSTESTSETSGTTAEADSGNGKELADTITLGLLMDPESMNPWLGAHDSRQQLYYNTIYEPLAQLNVDGELELILAKNITKNEDGTYSIELWDNIYDSEGNHITASDIAFSYEKCAETGQLAWGIRYLDHFDIIDDYNLIMYMADESAVGLNMVLKTCMIVSEASYKASPDDFSTTPVGTGPYILTEYTPGSSASIAVRDNYWQTEESARSSFSQVGSIQTVNFKVITESSQIALALQMGEIDCIAGNTGISSVNLGLFLDENRNPLAGYNSLMYEGSLIYDLELNCGDLSPLKDQKVRQAIAYAIDSPALVKNIWGVDGVACTTNSSPYYADYDVALDTQDYYSYNPEKAKELLAEAGYANGITVTLISQNSDQNTQMATLIQSYLGAVGITVEIVNVEPALFNNYRSDTVGDQWDICLNQVMSINTPGRFSELDVNAYTTGKNGLYIYDETLQELFLTANRAETYSKESVTELLNYVDEQMYLYPLGYANGYVITNDKFETIKLDRNSALLYGQCIVRK